MTTKTARNIIARGSSNAAFAQLTGCGVACSGTTATLAKANHNLSNGDKVLIQGFAYEECNGVFTVANASTNTFDYTIKQDPGANPAGTPGTVDKVTLGTRVDLSTANSLQVVLGLQNTTSVPTAAPQFWVGIANADTEPDYLWRLLFAGDTVANSLTQLVAQFGGAAMFVNFAVCRNTGQAVDCYAIGSELTAA